MNFMNDHAVQLFQLARMIPQPLGDQERRKLSVDDESADDDQHENQDDRNDGDEKIGNDQAAAQSPQEPVPDEPDQPRQVVNAGRNQRDPEEEPPELRCTVGKEAGDFQCRTVEQNQGRKPRHPVGAILAAEGSEESSEHDRGR